MDVDLEVETDAYNENHGNNASLDSESEEEEDYFEAQKCPTETSVSLLDHQYSHISDQQFSQLEKMDGCFVCFACVASNSSNPFASWDGSEYNNHLATHHPDLKEITCIYCAAKISPDLAESHITHHLQQESSFPFECILCPFRSNSPRSFQLHMDGRHSNELTPDTLSCVHCQTEHSSVEALINHISSYLCILVHCSAPGCLVKSLSRNTILKHVEKFHSGLGKTLLTTTQVLCSEPDVKLPFARPSWSSTQLGKLFPTRHLDPLFTSSTFPSLPAIKPTVLCLKCPYCHLTTIRWEKFSMHQNSCPKLDRPEFQYRLFHCSVCQTASTERAIVKEHIEDQHALEKKASLVTEEICVNVIHPELLNRLSNGDTNSGKRGACDYPEYFSSTQDAKRPRIYDDPSMESETASTNGEVSSRILGDGCELVSFPFDEEAFRSALHHRPEMDSLVEKMRRFCAYSIRILGKENHRRIPECPECNKVFPHGLGDFKRHLLSVHLDMPREFLKECLRYTHLPKGEEQFQELQEQLAMRNLKPRFIEPGKKKIPLPYSLRVLRKLTAHFPRDTQEYLAIKMKIYSGLFVVMDVHATERKYGCYHCTYTSPHALADVRKHILGSHCGISTKHFRYCLQASRLDPIEFTLLSEDRLLRLANDFVKRKVKDPSDDIEDLPVEDMEYIEEDRKPIIPGDFELLRPNPALHHRPHKFGFSRPGISCGGGRKGSHTMPIEADGEIPLPLPYSEPVLRQLLNGFCSKEQVEEMVDKMAVYSSYQLTRVCRGRHTIAFKCPCGRVFHTDKLPGHTIRPATLADSRRHVMGVHAKITHEFLTICCQASRISRENEYAIYPDEMLLRMAIDRPPRTSEKKIPSYKIDPEPNEESPPEIIPESFPEVSNDDSPFIKMEAIDLDGSLGIRPKNTIVDQQHEPMEEEPQDTMSYYNNEDPDAIERTIELPYSVVALKRLTAGYCTEEYFPVLRHKMEIYKSYKVYVVRRDRRRMFCCSGCNSSSPHGMGDIRKHIFGVHSKVPERYKAAAMHCSRLSREDNSLLPDRVLMHLAKMKWKGTIIKPLSELSGSEMDVAMSGSIQRRPSTSRQSPFSSISMVSRNGTLIGSDEPASPIVEHQPFKRKKDQLVSVPDNMYIVSGKGKWGETQYSCSICRKTALHAGAIRGHIVRDHLNLPGCRCAICGELFNVKSGVVQHHNQHHPGVEFRVSQYSPYRHAMSRVVVRSACKKLGKLADPEPEPVESQSGDSTPLDSESSEPKPSVSSDMMTVPLTLEKPLHPANARDCFILRRKGGYGRVTFHCSVCQGSSSSLASIKSHVAQYHIGVFPFKCELCDTSFWKRESLISHFEYLHPDDKPNFNTPDDYKNALNNLSVKSGKTRLQTIALKRSRLANITRSYKAAFGSLTDHDADIDKEEESLIEAESPKDNEEIVDEEILPSE